MHAEHYYYEGNSLTTMKSLTTIDVNKSSPSASRFKLGEEEGGTTPYSVLMATYYALRTERLY